MKKNISINISGIIFHIEEDGYENLRKYLDSINKYFSSFEDSSEILADIESRIAELFLSKLSEGKQVITGEDVTALIATMGSVSDFKAAEEQESEEPKQQSSKTKEESSSGKSSYTYVPPKPFQRDQKRKILGGVCAGIGNYFNIDPVWVRLFTALMAFAYGIGFLIYLVLWVAIPGSYDLEEPETGKKMFRDTENKVLGGVSGGLAAFFGVDIVVVRLIFVLTTFFFGTGFLVYMVLWVVLPEARSLTDRMQMQGEPVTLSNIESNIKKNLNEDPEKEESALTKIILFPFRVIGMALNVLGKILVPIAEIIRVAIGVFIVLFGVGLLFTVVVSGGILLGVFTTTSFSFPWLMDHSEMGMPMHIFINSIPTWVVVAGFGAALIPVIFIMLLGSSIVSKKLAFNATTGWTLFVLFFVSVAMLGVGLPKIIYAFKEEGEFKIENTYPLPEKRVVLKINEVGMDDYDGVSLTLRGYEGKEIKLVQTFSSQGGTRQKAIENAQLVTYFVDVKDSIITFDSNIKFKDEAIFRNQRLELTLYVPHEYPIVMDKSIASRSHFVSHHIEWNNRDGYVWTLKEKGGLTCLNCPKNENDETGVQDQYGLSDFDNVELEGFIDVNISAGDDYAVEILGADSEKRKYQIYRSGKKLIVEYKGEKKYDFDGKFIDIDQVRINITMPSLEKIEGSGYGTIAFDEFTSDDMEIEINGPIKVKGSLNAHNLVLRLIGKSEVDLSGQVNNMDANLQLASKLKAYNLEVSDAVVEVSGVSTAKVNVLNTLEIDEDMTSDIDYHGTPQIIKKD
jgi:phage shock protein PspC (stress-responsive transcriptional regulator)